MNTQDALAFLYNATRLAPLSANDHDKIKEAALVLQEAITPKDEVKEEPKKK